MAIERYSRALAPSDPKSVTDYLNSEHLKLERVLDAILARLTDTEGRLTAGGL
jgi:hypothetical protein